MKKSHTSQDEISEGTPSSEVCVQHLSYLSMQAYDTKSPITNCCLGNEYKPKPHILISEGPLMCFVPIERKYKIPILHICRGVEKLLKISKTQRAIPIGHNARTKHLISISELQIDAHDLVRPISSCLESSHASLHDLSSVSATMTVNKLLRTLMSVVTVPIRRVAFDSSVARKHGAVTIRLFNAFMPSTKAFISDLAKKLFEALKVDSEILDNINGDFVDVVSQHHIQIHSFQEMQGISGVKGLHGKVRCSNLLAAWEAVSLTFSGECR